MQVQVQVLNQGRKQVQVTQLAVEDEVQKILPRTLRYPF
jgi:hypothetical protein